MFSRRENTSCDQGRPEDENHWWGSLKKTPSAKYFTAKMFMKHKQINFNCLLEFSFFWGEGGRVGPLRTMASIVFEIEFETVLPRCGPIPNYVCLCFSLLLFFPVYKQFFYQK